MGTRYESVSATEAGTGWEEPGENIGDDKLPPGNYALTINYDEVFYIQGTPEELRAFMIRLDGKLQQVEAHSQRPLGYGDIRVDEDGDYTCPRCEAFWSPRDQGDLFSLIAEVNAHLQEHGPMAVPALR